MSRNKLAIVLVSALLVAGCVDGDDFGGSGGSSGNGGFGGSGGSSDGAGQAGLSLARDACRNEMTSRGKKNVRIESAKQIDNGTAARVVLQTRRDSMSVNTESWRCKFSYSTGKTSIKRL